MKERIKLLRKYLGLNQTEFGARIGVKQTSVAGYETGARIPLAGATGRLPFALPSQGHSARRSPLRFHPPRLSGRLALRAYFLLLIGFALLFCLLYAFLPALSSRVRSCESDAHQRVSSSQIALRVRSSALSPQRASARPALPFSVCFLLRFLSRPCRYRQTKDTRHLVAGIFRLVGLQGFEPGTDRL